MVFSTFLENTMGTINDQCYPLGKRLQFSHSYQQSIFTHTIDNHPTLWEPFSILSQDPLTSYSFLAACISLPSWLFSSSLKVTIYGYINVLGKCLQVVFSSNFLDMQMVTLLGGGPEKKLWQQNTYWERQLWWVSPYFNMHFQATGFLLCLYTYGILYT